MSPWKDVGPDFALETPNGVIFVEVKRRISDADLPAILETIRRAAEANGESVKVTLLADNERIVVYRGVGQDAAPVAELPTATILKKYDPDFEHEVVYEDYLLSLLRAWLNDFSFSKAGTEPPGTNELPDDVVAVLAA